MVSLLGQLNHILSLSYEPRERLVARLPKIVGMSLPPQGVAPYPQVCHPPGVYQPLVTRAGVKGPLYIIVHFTSR